MSSSHNSHNKTQFNKYSNDILNLRLFLTGHTTYNVHFYKEVIINNNVVTSIVSQPYKL